MFGSYSFPLSPLATPSPPLSEGPAALGGQNRGGEARGAPKYFGNTGPYTQLVFPLCAWPGRRLAFPGSVSHCRTLPCHSRAHPCYPLLSLAYPLPQKFRQRLRPAKIESRRLLPLRCNPGSRTKGWLYLRLTSGQRAVGISGKSPKRPRSGRGVVFEHGDRWRTCPFPCLTSCRRSRTL